MIVRLRKEARALLPYWAGTLAAVVSTHGTLASAVTFSALGGGRPPTRTGTRPGSYEGCRRRVRVNELGRCNRAGARGSHCGRWTQASRPAGRRPRVRSRPMIAVVDELRRQSSPRSTTAGGAIILAESRQRSLNHGAACTLGAPRQHRRRCRHLGLLSRSRTRQRPEVPYGRGRAGSRHGPVRRWRQKCSTLRHRWRHMMLCTAANQFLNDVYQRRGTPDR